MCKFKISIYTISYLLKMKQIVFFIILLSVSCRSNQQDMKHIFYLHGRIIELQGINAVSEQFGKYEYLKIIEALKDPDVIVHSEIRTQDTDFNKFSNKVSSQIDSLISKGTKSKNITVIGASKGAVMAMNISNMNKNPINYILLGANSDNLEKTYDWNLHRRILGIYEKSDVYYRNSYNNTSMINTKVINIKSKFDQFNDHWSPKIIADLNGQHVKLAKLEGEFVWHDHKDEDEMFLIINGSLIIEFRDRTEILNEGDMIVVPRGVEHRPIANKECWVMLFEPAQIKHTGDVEHEKTVREYEVL